MCMPQLQEGDEIVHINGRIVKELPHQEVLCFLWFIPSLLTPGSKNKFSLLLTIHFFNGTSATSETRLFTDSIFQQTRRKKRARMQSTRGWGRKAGKLNQSKKKFSILSVPTYYSTAFCWYLTAFLGLLLQLRFIRPFALLGHMVQNQPCCGAVYTVTRTSPAQLSFVLKVPLCNFRPGRTNSLLLAGKF